MVPRELPEWTITTAAHLDRGEKENAQATKDLIVNDSRIALIHRHFKENGVTDTPYSEKVDENYRLESVVFHNRFFCFFCH